MTVYDKSPAPAQPSDETFLYHICRTYHDLPEYLVLVQGRPFDHMAGICEENICRALHELLAQRPTEAVPLLTRWTVEPPTTFPGLRVNEYYTHVFQRPAREMYAFAAGCQYVVPRARILARPWQFWASLYAMVVLGDACTVQEACHPSRAFVPSEITPWTVERLFGPALRDDGRSRCSPL